MQPSHRLCLLIVAIGTLALLPAAPLSASDDELVVVDEGELNAYWRVDQRDLDIFQLGGDGPGVYGCAAVPIVIEPKGVVAPGQRPLLLRVGQGAGEGRVSDSELYEYAVGALPRYTSTWDKVPSTGIYSTRSTAFMDVGTRERLGPERARQLYLALIAACRINQLAAWLAQHDDATVSRPLPVDPGQWLDQGTR
jgi:hypothetical protein